jgi:hypothetical protein
MKMAIKDQVQGVVQALFGAYAGGYLAELTAEATAGSVGATAARLTSIQGVILGQDLKSNTTFVDIILANLGVNSLSPAYPAAAKWANDALAGGKTRADVVTAAVAFLEGISAGTIVDTAYTNIAKAYTDKVAAGIAYSESTVGSKVLSLAALQDEAGTSSSFNVASAVTGLIAAQKAVVDFAATLDLNKNGKLDTTTVAKGGDGATTASVLADVHAAVSANDGSAKVTQAEAFNLDVNASVSLDSTSTAAQISSAYAAARANAQAAIDAKQAIVDAKQLVVTALNDATDVAAYTSAVAAKTASAKALVTAGQALTEAVTVFGLANYANANATVTTPTNALTTSSVVTYDNDRDGDTDEVNLIVWDAALNDGKGAFKLATAVTDAAYNKAADTAEAKLVAQATVVLTAVQAAYNAKVADTKAGTALTTAQSKVGDGTSSSTDGYGAVDALEAAKTASVDDGGSLKTATAAQTALETKITALNAAYELDKQLKALEKTVDSAEATLAKEGWDLNDADLGDVTKDLYIWTAKADLQTGLFTADDVLYIGSGYSLVVLPANKTLADSIGDASKLEVIYDKLAGKLYVEDVAYAGNTATTPTVDTAVIQLTGVSTDVQLVNGYITLA